jgi:hypothetical protein
LAFKKVLNNKNKGSRVNKPINGVDTSFVIPRGTVLTFFVREDSYEAGKSIFVKSGEQAHIEAYTQVIMQLSGTNIKQAGKGNRLKLHWIMSLQSEAFSSFMDDLCSSKCDTLDRQDNVLKYQVIAHVAGRAQACPVVCNMLSGEFVHQDAELDERGMLEIVDSGLEPDMGSVLLLPTSILLV